MNDCIFTLTLQKQVARFLLYNIPYHKCSAINQIEALILSCSTTAAVHISGLPNKRELQVTPYCTSEFAVDGRSDQSIPVEALASDYKADKCCLTILTRRRRLTVSSDTCTSNCKCIVVLCNESRGIGCI